MYTHPSQDRAQNRETPVEPPSPLPALWASLQVLSHPLLCYAQDISGCAALTTGDKIEPLFFQNHLTSLQRVCFSGMAITRPTHGSFFHSIFFAVVNRVQSPEAKGKPLLALFGLGWVKRGPSPVQPCFEEHHAGLMSAVEPGSHCPDRCVQNLFIGAR